MAHILTHNPATVCPPAGGYSMGVELTQHRRLLFVSGQVPEESDGVVPEGFEAHASRPGATSSQCLPLPASASSISSRSRRS